MNQKCPSKVNIIQDGRQNFGLRRLLGPLGDTAPVQMDQVAKVVANLPKHFAEELWVEKIWLLQVLDKAQPLEQNLQKLRREAGRRLWLIEGAIKHKIDLTDLMRVYGNQKRIDTVPEHYFYPEIMTHKS